MAGHPLTLSHVRIQSQPHALAAVHAWTLLKAACGHFRPFFDDGPAGLPKEPCAPFCSPLAGGQEVAL
ncbi:MAG: hypothetical protein B193_0045 [Solidesulfovibrio magneticus str. Maddingley MBC34]|uniref:Uncharacterized protein n=1 Tax=Solidesulfovibrio magneticus str. Maddingley MBC34 TaxID=1206767 RepID=K6GWA9_9BACT|nr:MAG: hypothetical protein B193_0045 [Solidesulfovibrio magneticus str. Maddingley MBC34]